MKVLNIPGWKNADEGHWQSLWEAGDPSVFSRVHQVDWLHPDKDQWVPRIAEAIRKAGPEVLITAHSIGVAAFVHAVTAYDLQVRGAMLVAPSDAEATDYPKVMTGFTPIPQTPLPFRSIVVASSNDPAVSLARATTFAINWQSSLHILQEAGHIETKSGFGEWLEGKRLLKTLASGQH